MASVTLCAQVGKSSINTGNKTVNTKKLAEIVEKCALTLIPLSSKTNIVSRKELFTFAPT